MSIEVLVSILSPVIGSFLGTIKKPSQRLVYHMLAFAGGIMLAVSFLDLIPSSISYSNYMVCIYGLIIGFFIMYLLELIMPERNSLKSTAYFLASGMAVHNFSEGMAIAITATLNSKISFVVAISIAVHNIAEGICTASPMYYSIKSKLKSFIISSLTAVPLYLGYITVENFFIHASTVFLGLLLSITAGLMLYITTAELIPASSNNKSNFATVFSLILGVIIVLVLEYI